MTNSKYAPTRDLVFTETMQIGIVVRDLDATLRRHVDDYGIGRWEILQFTPRDAKHLHEYGRPVERSWRLAVTMVGPVMWELIEPLDNEASTPASLPRNERFFRLASAWCSPSVI